MTTTMSAETVLAHLSDVHLPPPAPLPNWKNFTNKRFLSVASWKKHRQHVHQAELSDLVIADIATQHPDLVLNTGDLTNFGLKEEYENAARWTERLGSLSLLVPGNHDAMVRQKWSDSGKLWAQWMPGTEDENFPFVFHHNDLAVIGINSSVPTPPFMACGRVGAAQLQRLADVLHATRHSCRVIMIHHPPRKGLVPWRKSLLDHRAVADVIARHGAAMVLHGHSHDASFAFVPGTSIPLIGVPSASLCSSRPWRQAGWNRITVKRAVQGWSMGLTTHQYTAAEGWRVSRQKHWSVKNEGA